MLPQNVEAKRKKGSCGPINNDQLKKKTDSNGTSKVIESLNRMSNTTFNDII